MAVDTSHFSEINRGLLLGVQMRATKEFGEQVLEVDEVRIEAERA